jgi:hypothetical protein
MRDMSLQTSPLEVTPVGASHAKWQRRDRVVVSRRIPVLGLLLLVLGILLR